MTTDDTISADHQGLRAVKDKIAAAAKDVGRSPADIELIVVSKTFGPDEILPVLNAGQRHFGENRVQEAAGKWPALRDKFPDITLHLIGPLQSNKTKEAVTLFDAIHSIDRPKIAKAIAEEQAKLNKELQLFIQVNTGEEPQKAGVLPRDTAQFLDQCQNEFGLKITGLMCIPPVDEEPAVHFAFLAKLARELDLPGLSMGMSGDFEAAVELGATHVRVGSAIFGARV
ncbi:conserved protein of unknown function [Candidatus Filomicrobium marinum]|uniref:Pyridoxal phosphate homeostasis protein n=1 Tax=Candidatus Filomicrobium marinum TaxID=1608628 RepID=A0A0D6JCA5_9HYPH|nr:MULTISPECIES: YggS family pyridoxal phosphate-dependent enzyme [Filomicrobium]MCV0370541.1 YggS family pyridoxal phosphate-dependent enzyme [Filomicrobium sp.]CFX08037.1 conserved protein of unknown function [Candidatus Filomicrobium marinum]CPR16722.1 conserved protein of unknown function [Candidatus Filomicrobium marinum]